MSAIYDRIARLIDFSNDRGMPIFFEFMDKIIELQARVTATSTDISYEIVDSKDSYDEILNEVLVNYVENLGT